MKFTKMQGIGNDYIYVNCFEETVENPEKVAKKISDRHFGVGSDGLVLICPDDQADFRMRMYNSDGSESEMCGNATRCIGKYVYERGLTKKTEVSLMTGAGIKILQLRVNHGKVESVRVDMGEPQIQATGETVKAKGTVFPFTRVSTGNPHAVIFLDDVDQFDVAGYGAEIECNPVFPNRTPRPPDRTSGASDAPSWWASRSSSPKCFRFSSACSWFFLLFGSSPLSAPRRVRPP